MTYRSSQLAKVIFSQNVAETPIWLWWMPLAEFQISDWIFGTPLKFWSGWYITFSIRRCFSSCHNFCHRTLQFMPYMAIAGATGRISNFWLDIQHPLEILVRMIYNILYLKMFFYIRHNLRHRVVSVHALYGMVQARDQQIQNLLKISIMMIYKTSHLGQVQISHF